MEATLSACGRPRRGVAAVLVAALLACTAAAAQPGLTDADLGYVDLTPPADARLPMDAPWRDEGGTRVTLAEAMDGRPALVIFADYTCKTLCGPILSIAAGALAAAKLDTSDYRLIALGLNSNDGPAEADAMRRNVVPVAVAPAARLLTGDAPTIRAAAAAVGYRYRYDAAQDQFAHPAAMLTLTADGHVSRVLAALTAKPEDIRLALVEAGRGRIGTLRDQVRLLCYGFDPSAGAYTLSVHRALAAATVLTVAAFAAAIAWMSLRPRRPSDAAG